MNREGILKQLFSAYPGSKATLETVAMYDRLLADIPDDELQAAIDQTVSTSEFLPTIAKIRDLHFRLQHISALGWADSWDLVQKEMRRIGSYGMPVFNDELTTRVVKAMGWKALCASENAATDRAQFRDMYNDMAQRSEFGAKLTPAALQIAHRSNGTKLLEVAP